MKLLSQNHSLSLHAARIGHFLYPFGLIICLLLISCQGNSPSASSTAIYPTSTATENAVKVVPSSTSIPTVTLTSTPVFSFQITSACPEIQESFPLGLSHGILSFIPRDINNKDFLNLETHEIYANPDGIAGWAIVSPDRNHVAYGSTNRNTFNVSLVVRVLQEHKKISLPWPYEDSLNMPRWQNNSQILFTLRAETDPDVPYPFRNGLLNPFTGQTSILNQDFPRISTQHVNWNDSGAVAYDQSLDYAIYAAWNEEKNEHEYVLWHIPSQTQLAVLPGNLYGWYTADYAGHHRLDGAAYNPPAWSPDDTRVALISSSPDNIKMDEIFIVTKDGDIQQLTEFSSQYETLNLRALSWSPDGGEIAFFVNPEPDINQGKRTEQLVILNTQTGDVSMYCLNGDMYGTRSLPFIGDHEQIPAPLWSPDGTQLIIEDRFKETESRLILIDIPSNTAYAVGQNMQPFGWMLSEP